mmetsp:Transcript_19021/g.47777  ORF Transcript_19021/g.47777 Transcript_19021/m.47777 type:complete len:284 (-) Transcript_19021:322-1173(-)
MLSALSGSVAFAPTTGVRAPTVTTASVRMETKADLEVLAKKLNPTVGFYDPLGLADAVVDGSNEAAIGYLRHAEIKHGRVAMAAFVGYCVQSNGICFPWNLQGPLPISAATANLPVISFADISAAGGPADQWDALPSAAKLQILVVIGFLEMWSETSTVLKLDGEAHYVRGGKPGYFPKLNRKDDAAFPHPVPLNLWDPFGFTSKMSPERKEKALLAEINNGRLAMLGIMAFVSEARVPGSVPGLANANIASYSGEVMAPWGPGDTSVLYVDKMLEYGATLFK